MYCFSLRLGTKQGYLLSLLLFNTVPCLCQSTKARKGKRKRDRTRDKIVPICKIGFPSGLDGKAPVYNGGDPGSIPGLGRPLEKEMAIHFRTIAWRIPWTEEPGRLQSMGSQRVGHN